MSNFSGVVVTFNLPNRNARLLIQLNVVPEIEVEPRIRFPAKVFFLRPTGSGLASGAVWQSLSLNGGRRRSSGVVERGEVQGRPKAVTTTPTNSRAILFV